MKTTVLLTAMLVLAAATATATEKKIREADVPKPVLDAIQKKYPTAKLTGFEVENENGKTAYEIKLSDGKKQLEVVCSPAGKIVAEEEQIAIEEVPAKVRDALKASAKYGTWTVHHVERVVNDGNAQAPEYEIKVVSGKQAAELVFTPDGKLTRTEEKKPHEKD